MWQAVRKAFCDRPSYCCLAVLKTVTTNVFKSCWSLLWLASINLCQAEFTASSCLLDMSGLRSNLLYRYGVRQESNTWLLNSITLGPRFELLSQSGRSHLPEIVSVHYGRNKLCGDGVQLETFLMTCVCVALGFGNEIRAARTSQKDK